jgi:hypothetical protein
VSLAAAGLFYSSLLAFGSSRSTWLVSSCRAYTCQQLLPDVRA